MSRSWRDWKGRVKKNGYHAFDTDEKRLANCPDGVIGEQWRALIAMWNSEESQVSDFFQFYISFNLHIIQIMYVQFDYFLQFLLILMFMICHAQKVATVNKENAAKQDFWQSTGKKPLPVLRQQV